MSTSSKRHGGQRAALIGAVGVVLAAILTVVLPLVIAGNLFDRETCESGKEPWTVAAGSWEVRPGFARHRGLGLGLLFTPMRLREGRIEATVAIPSYQTDCRAHIVFGGEFGDYLTAGVGGDQSAFSIGLLRQGRAEEWASLASMGLPDALDSASSYHIAVERTGETTTLRVNDVQVAEALTPIGKEASEVGILAANCEEVEFVCIKVCK